MPRLTARHLVQPLRFVSRLRPLPTSGGPIRQAAHSRYASSTVQSPPTGGVPLEPILNPAAPPTAPRARSTRYLRLMIQITSFFLLGGIGGALAGSFIVPPPLPVPDSEDDAAMLAKIKRDASGLDVVKELRTAQSKAEGWIEYEAFMGLPDEIRDRNMSAGAMKGTRGIGLRRMWWNGKKRELVGVLFLGGAIAGWPGVVHGGALISILLEGIATVGSGGPKEIRGLMSADTTQDAEKEMVRDFGINYLKPTAANRLYVIKAKFQEEDDQLVECWLEDALTGRTTVKASGRVGAQSVIPLGDGDSSGTGIFGQLTKTLFG